MHFAGSLHSVEPVVLELASQEGICEGNWPGEILGWHVHLTGQLVSIGHIAGHVERIS